jgi:GT2 family glycosyltransferase
VNRCLSSVLTVQSPNFEIILVDNGSTDGGVEKIKKTFDAFPKLRIVETGMNLGASAGRNIGARLARGDYLAFLDTDTEVDSRWLDEAIDFMRQSPSVGAVQCKLLLMSDRSKVDYVGDLLSQFGFLVQRRPLGYADDNTTQKAAIVFGVKSAGMVIRRDLFRKVGMFDEDFFIYMEETDLCWRVWLSGFQVAYAPLSIVYHDFGGLQKLISPRTKFLAKYHGTKNYITTILKDAGDCTMVKIIPIHIASWVGIMLWHFGRRRPLEGIWILRGITYNLRNFGRIWRKRIVTQHSVRRVSDDAIVPSIMTRVSPMYLYRKATDEGSGWKL